MFRVAGRDGVAVVRLDHGPVNALDLELLTALPGVFANVADARAVVLTGTGRCFSAGVDLKRVIEGGAPYVAEFIPALGRAVLAVFDHPKPVVAAINGHALAGGCVLAAACDRRVMSGGTIGLTELAAGVPFPAVPLEVMRYALGPKTDDLVLTARTMGPAEALELGLVHVVSDDPVTAAIAQAVALAHRPEVYALTKEHLHRPLHERIALRDDDRVIEVWGSGETREILGTYLGSLRKPIR